jgi:hypothetical protein
LRVIEKKDRSLSVREMALAKREEVLMERFFKYKLRHQENRQSLLYTCLRQPVVASLWQMGLTILEK